jgi:hypothetical protein
VIERYAALFDQHGVEVGTLVTFADGMRTLPTDPQPYLMKTGRGYKLPPRLWPLYDAAGEQVRLLEPVPRSVSGSESETEAA